jgi:hypothetical protein
MSRIIIENISSLPDDEAVRLVQRVMSDGFLSKETIQGEKNIPKYCHVTSFKEMSSCVRHIVEARSRKTKTSAYPFRVYTSYIDCVEEES